MENFYIGIDVGTGSARACIIDESGIIRSTASEDIKLWMPETGHYEQSTSDIWRCVCISIRRALSQNQSIPVSRIRGIGIAATCSLAVFSDKSNSASQGLTPVPVTGPSFANDGNDRNVILWLDHRAVAETAIINATQAKVLRYVGEKMSVEMEIPKILWLKQHMPADMFGSCKFFDLADALTYLATGNEARSLCSTVCKQGYLPSGIEGAVEEGWQRDFFRDIGLGEFALNGFCKLGGIKGVSGNFLSAGELAGSLSQRAALELGLPAGIAVGSGVIDAYAGWVGTVATKFELENDGPLNSTNDTGVDVALTRLAAVAGTSTCHLAMSSEPVFVGGIWGPYRDILIPKYWMAEGGQSATGELLKYVLENHPAIQEALSNAGDRSIYEFLNDHLDEIKSKLRAPSISFLGRHLFFYGDLWGNRSPLADPMMTGAYIGLTSDKSISGLALQYYSALEFIALQTRQIIEAMNLSGHNICSIFMSGSQCQNKVLMDLISTTSNMPVVIPRYETTAVVHGAAMLGVKAASAAQNDHGNDEDLWSIMERMSQPGHVIAPANDQALKRLIGAKYDVFLDMYETQQKYRKDIDKATEG